VDDPAWHITGGDGMQVNCHYLYLVDNLLDPSHVAWVHKNAFASPGTENTPLEISELDDGVIASRWVMDTSVPGYYQPLVKFEGNCDRLQHYEVRFPSIAINKSTYTPAGQGGPDMTADKNTYVMISYNFLTPIDANSSGYYWLQQRNTDPDNESIFLKLFIRVWRNRQPDPSTWASMRRRLFSEQDWGS
jgi:vanillate O-demethylase monooxygenase subunit